MGSIKEDTTLESVRDNYYAGQDCLIELHYKVDPKEEEVLKEEEIT